MCSNERLSNIELSSDNLIRCDITCTSTYRLKITYANTFHFISTLTDQSGLRTYKKVVLFKEKGSVSFVVF